MPTTDPPPPRDPDGHAAPRPVLSVVVPCYNEEEVLEQTHARLVAALEAIDLPFELVYVNDGSRDSTMEQLRSLADSDPRVRAIGFARNFGHQIAVTAGIDHAHGDAVILIDADLQDPPEVIGDMVARWREGYHVAYGRRTDREGESAFKLGTAKFFYRILNTLSDVDIPLDTGDFRLMDRCVVDVLKQMPERDRFIRGMVSWVGFKQTDIPYSRAERAAGESKYPFWKMLRFAIDGIVSFSVLPLRLATVLGFVSLGLAVIGIVYTLFVKFFTGIEGWAMTYITILFLGGSSLMCLGIIGEYVGRIYREIKHRPLYVVHELRGFA